MSHRYVLVPLALLGLLACGGEPDAEESLESRSFRDVMEQAGEDEYTPPADGKITENQLEMYFEVRKHEKAVAEAARQKLEQTAEDMKGEEKSLTGFIKGVKGMGSIADYMTADIRAAQDLGYNTAEYRWVKEQVAEAIAVETTRRMTNNVRKQFAEQKEQMQERLETASSDAERQMYEALLAQIEESEEKQSGQSDLDESVRHNLLLITEREDLEEVIGNELSRWGADVDIDELRENLKEN